jgi:hypothetical protein
VKRNRIKNFIKKQDFFIPTVDLLIKNLLNSSIITIASLFLLWIPVYLFPRGDVQFIKTIHHCYVNTIFIIVMIVHITSLFKGSRKCERFAVADYGETNLDSVIHSVGVENISKGGVKIISQTKLTVDAAITISIKNKLRKAVVKWSAKDSFGLKFLK